MFDALVPQVLTPKQKFAAIVQEGLAVQLSAQAGMSKEISEVMVTYLSRRHALARQEAAQIAEETPEIKAMGKPGQAPLMSVFYMNSAKALREMAREWVTIQKEEDREFLLMVAESREAIAHALVKNFTLAEEAMGKARERGFVMISKKCPVAAGKRGQA